MTQMLRALAVGGCMAIAPIIAAAAPITNFSSVTIEHFTSLDSGTSPPPEFVDQIRTNSQRATASLSRDDSFGDRVSSGEARLSAGTLKAASSVEDVRSDRYTITGVFSAIGDSFRTVDAAGSPFAWNNSSAQFSMSVDGLFGRSNGDGALAIGRVQLFILKAGALDAFVNDNGLPLITTSNAENLLSHYAAGLTPDSTHVFDWATIETQTYELRNVDYLATSLPVTLNYQFQPGQDFDWLLRLEVGANVLFGHDFSDFAVSDFSNTVSLAYTGPTGSQTYSASGVFPGTLAVNAVPEPGTLWLALVTGLIVIPVSGHFRRKRDRQAAQISIPTLVTNGAYRCA